MGKSEKKITKRAVFALVLCCLMPVVAFGQSGGTTIYGSIISSYEWVGESHAGLYSFNTEGGAVFTPVKIEPGLCAQGGGVYAGHAYYSFSVDDNTLYVYDADTWEQTAAYPTDIAALDLAYDPTTGNIYGCFVDNGAKLGVLVPEEGSYEYIADFNMSLAALVCSNEGQLYGIGSDGLLYRIDKATAAMAEIGNTGIYPMMAQSATIDPNTGKCYWAATSFGATGLYEVDLDTGNASLLYLFPNEEEITGLFILEEVPADAPAKANGLQVDFPNGSTTGSIRFVMPTMTCGGAALDGTLDYTLLMNDEVKEGTGQPGETISLENITLEAGDYKFVLTVSNDKGTGERAVVSQWIGMDAPAAVENLMLKKQSEATVALSWEAPRTGIHQGYVDAASLRYRVVRYPGNVVLHEDYPQTSFTEDIEADKLAQYWYVVTPAAGGMEGEEASSNKVVMGPGYEMPYEEDFSTTTRFNQFTLMDANGDGRTWQQDIAMEVAQYMADTPEKADDWLVTPPLKLDEDGYYQLSFSVKCNSMDAHRISVALGNLPEVESLSTVLLPSQDFNTNFEWLALEAASLWGGLALVWLGMMILPLAALAFVGAVAFAYGRETIVTWNMWQVPAALCLNALVGGPCLALAGFAAARAPLVDGEGKALLIASGAALIANVAVYVAQGVALAGMGNSFGAAMDLAPGFWAALVAFLALCAAGLAASLGVRRFAGAWPYRRRLVVSCGASALVFAGIFLMRFVFYMTHMTVGL